MTTAKNKKYDYRVVQDEDGSAWTAEITRRVTSRKTMVSKSQNGFTTESEALAWAEEEIKSFVKNHVKQNELRTEIRQEKAEKARHWQEAKDKRKAENAKKLWKK
jgi:hypothetical protein